MIPYELLSSSYGLLVEEAMTTASTLVPIKALRPAFLDDLFQHVAIQTIFQGQVLFEDGSVDGQFIYLQSGEAYLEYENGHVELLSAAAINTPVAHEQPRPCRFIAKTDCIVMRIDSDRVDRTLSWSQITDYLLSELSLERKYDDDIEWMQTVLNSNLFLKAPPVNAQEIFLRLTPMVVSKGETIITQGELGDSCYFIKEGEAKVTSKNKDLRRAELVAEIGPGRCFGEDSLVNETVRNASVVMKTDGLLMRLEKSDFAILLREPSVEEVTLADIRALVEDPIYVDIRTEEEYAAGHLAFSANIPLALLSIKKRQLAPERTYILYCDTGRRSCAAAYLLGRQGFNVMALAGGISGEGLEHRLVKDENYILRNGDLLAGQ